MELICNLTMNVCNKVGAFIYVFIMYFQVYGGVLLEALDSKIGKLVPYKIIGVVVSCTVSCLNDN